MTYAILQDSHMVERMFFTGFETVKMGRHMPKFRAEYGKRTLCMVYFTYEAAEIDLVTIQECEPRACIVEL